MRDTDRAEALEALHKTVALQESLRAALGNEAVDAAIAALQHQIELLEGTAPTGRDTLERKHITAMFADLSGFTAMSERIDPEKVRAMIGACFERLVAVIHRYDGTVEKFIGDAIFSVFGAPVAHEDDPERALRTALEMFDALAEFNREHGVELGLHVGVNTGLVVAGEFGACEAQQYTVTGDTVNLAARLEDLSQTGEILVGPATWRLTREKFAFETREPVRLKGKAQPVPVYRLLGIQRPAAGDGRRRATLVGRDTEMDRVMSHVAAAGGGTGGFVLVTGDAGLGKSRILSEVRSRCGRDLQWFEGSTLSFTRNLAYWPFLQMLRAFAGISEDDDGAATRARLQAAVRTCARDETDEIVPYLSVLLGVDVAESDRERVAHLDAEAMRHQVFRAVRRTFERLCAAGPVVAAIEDLHWADAASLGMLEHLAGLTGDAPLLILATSRLDPPDAVARIRKAGQACEDRFTEVRLDPLDTAAAGGLAGALLEGGSLAPELAAFLQRKAGGNPFFLEELVRAILEGGGARLDEPRRQWVLTDAHLRLPDTLQGVVMARVDRLSTEVKETLKTAAVIGPSFLERLLGEMMGSNDSLDGSLRTLQEQHLVLQHRADPELEWVFRHALARDVVYESISLERRRALHGRLAACIETLHAGRLGEFCGLLAYHYAAAENWEKAQQYLFAMADQAGRVAADEEALAHYRHAMAAYERAFGDRWDPVARARLERCIGEALFRRGDHGQAREHLERAASVLGFAMPSSRWGVRAAIARAALRQWLGRPAAGTAADARLEERFRINKAMGWIEFGDNHERFLLMSLEHLNAAEDAADACETAAGCVALGMAATLMGFPRLSRYYHRRARGIAEGADGSGALAMAWLGTGIYEAVHGTLHAAVDALSKARDTAWRAGEAQVWASASVDMAGNLLNRGDCVQGLQVSQELLRVARDTGDRQARGWGLLGVGLAQLHLGHTAHGETALAEARDVLWSVPDHHTLPQIYGLLASCALRSGRLEAAEAEIETGERIVREHLIVSHLMGYLRNVRARAWMARAEEGSGRVRGEALRAADRACAVARRDGRTTAGSLPEALALSGSIAWLAGRRGAARRWWSQGVAEAERTGNRWGLALVLAEWGTRAQAPARSAQAERLWDEMGVGRVDPHTSAVPGTPDPSARNSAAGRGECPAGNAVRGEKSVRINGINGIDGIEVPVKDDA